MIENIFASGAFFIIIAFIGYSAAFLTGMI